MAGGLSYQWSRLNQAERLIAINVAVFVIAGLLDTFQIWFAKPWFWLPSDLTEFISKPWSIITYSFFHGGLWHLLFNMLWLYFSGRMVLNLFDRMRFLSVYFLGVILGGLLFLLAYNTLPNLVNLYTPMVGASAGVLAVFIFICAYIPNQEVRLFGIINIKLWQIGAFFVLLDLLRLAGGGDNTGGYIAHLGGAALGYFYGRQLLNGRDIGAGFTRFIEGIGRAFTPKAKRPFKKVYKNSPKNTAKSKKKADEKSEKQQKIDEILDKISKSGYESLSKSEKDFLFQAGKEDE